MLYHNDHSIMALSIKYINFPDVIKTSDNMVQLCNFVFKDGYMPRLAMYNGELYLLKDILI